MRICAFAAIDPGVKGGLVALNDNGALDATAAPECDFEKADMLDHMREVGIKRVFIENLVLFNGVARPGASMARYAASFGFWKGAAMATGFRVYQVAPQLWQRTLGLERGDRTPAKWKSYLADVARERFPNARITLQTADAALLAAAAQKGFGDGYTYCGGCSTVLANAQFHKGATKGSRRCKACTKVRARKYWLPHNYGINATEYQQRLDAQNGRCAICRREPPEPEEGKAPAKQSLLNVDHCHSSGAVRGLLCRNCNWGLGNFGDAPERLQSAIEYLEKFAAKISFKNF